MLIRFGSDQLKIIETGTEAPRIEIPLPVLDGNDSERILQFSGGSASSPQFSMWQDGDLTFGASSLAMGADSIEACAYCLYKELFGLLKGRLLYRIWNYAPRINEGEGDLEIYKLFCRGRSNAFHEYYGDHDEASMPSGSCVGADGDRLIVYFLAGLAQPSHHENPQQVPAYRYPRKYGPKSPSFARATSVRLKDDYHRFISGTASVIGSESIGVGDLRKQLMITCGNLEIVELQSRVDVPDHVAERAEVSGKVYLRRREDFAEARDYLLERMPQWSGSLVFLKGDICREELLVEIELNFINRFV